jgi:hypothetical protein
MSGLPPSSNDQIVKPSVPKSADDISNFLKEDTPTDDKKVKGEEDDKKTKDDDDITLKDLEDDDEKLDLDDKKDDDKKRKAKDKDDEDEYDEDDKDKLDEDELEIEAPPRKKEITAAYPDFFKKFPWMEKMMYRDRQYTELFGSFDDAREVAESAEVLQAFEQDLMQGNTVSVLSKVKEIDPKAFDKLVDNYLPNLAKVDKEAYFEVVGNIGKHIIKDIANEGMKRLNAGDKDTAGTLKAMANLLNQFLFGTTEFVEPVNRFKKDEKADEVDQERVAFVRERFETVRDDLQSKVDKILRATISEYIDPKDEMSAYEKRNAVRDCLLDVHKSIREDPMFIKSLDRLWENVFSTRFSNDAQGRVQRAYLGKSKTVLRAAIKRARAEALKDSSSNRRPRIKEDDDKDEKEETPTRRRTADTGRPHQQSGKRSLERQKGESVLEFLSRE